MAPEIQKKEGSSSRQKMIIIATVLVVILLIWQVMGLFSSGSSSTPPPTTTAMTANAPLPPTPPTSNQQGVMSYPAQAAGELRQAPQPTSAPLVDQQQMAQNVYIKKLNELEELKVEKEIAETNQAIAAARLATQTAEKQVSDLLKPQAPPVSSAQYATGLVAPTASGATVVPGSGQVVSTEITTTTVIPEVEYTLISVSMQLNKWYAVVGYQGKLFNVAIGDILPPDGSMVANISKSGVVLKKDGKTRRISMVSSI